MRGPAFTLCHALVNANWFRLYLAAIVAVAATSEFGAAQAPSSAPLSLRLPAGTRATSLGNAWVAGRDEDVVFYNPAQIVARTGFNLSLARYGSSATQASMASGYAAGPWSMALGWGIQFADLHAPADYNYPLTPDAMSERGAVDVFTMQAVAGVSFLVKGFRIGAAGKYATDRASAAASGSSEQRHDVFLADVGLARNIFSGTAALSVQNIGNGPTDGDRTIDAPLQASLGWSSNPRQTGEFDLGLYTQVTARTGWISPAAGAELNYGWIEGFGIGLRAGARRPETAAEKPFTLGAAFTGDHLIVEYAHQFFDGGHHANRMTIRWR
jgi:hypothetical protein